MTGLEQLFAATLLTLGTGGASTGLDLRYPVETTLGVGQGIVGINSPFCGSGNEFVGEARVVAPLIKRGNNSVELFFTHHSCALENMDLRQTNMIGLQYKRVWK